MTCRGGRVEATKLKTSHWIASDQYSMFEDGLPLNLNSFELFLFGASFRVFGRAQQQWLK